jgi:acyl dehydratase
MTVFNSIEELRKAVGTDVGTSQWLRIGQDRVNGFAEVTEDHQWIHVDPERAAGGPFGTTIAHGYLTLSLIVPLMAEAVRVEGIRMGVNYGLNKVRFPSPVPVGSKVRAHGHLLSVEDVKDGVQVTYRVTVEREGSEKPACVAETVSRLYP